METRERVPRADTEDEPRQTNQEAADGDRCELAAACQEEGVGEDAVELMHREFSNRRKIVLSNLPPDFVEEVSESDNH